MSFTLFVSSDNISNGVSLANFQTEDDPPTIMTTQVRLPVLTNTGKDMRFKLHLQKCFMDCVWRDSTDPSEKLTANSGTSVSDKIYITFWAGDTTYKKRLLEQRDRSESGLSMYDVVLHRAYSDIGEFSCFSYYTKEEAFDSNSWFENQYTNHHVDYGRPGKFIGYVDPLALKTLYQIPYVTVEMVNNRTDRFTSPFWYKKFLTGVSLYLPSLGRYDIVENNTVYREYYKRVSRVTPTTTGGVYHPVALYTLRQPFHPDVYTGSSSMRQVSAPPRACVNLTGLPGIEMVMQQVGFRSDNASILCQYALPTSTRRFEAFDDHPVYARSDFDSYLVSVADNKVWTSMEPGVTSAGNDAMLPFPNGAWRGEPISRFPWEDVLPDVARPFLDTGHIGDIPSGTILPVHEYLYMPSGAWTDSTDARIGERSLQVDFGVERYVNKLQVIFPKSEERWQPVALNATVQRTWLGSSSESYQDVYPAYWHQGFQGKYPFGGNDGNTMRYLHTHTQDAQVNGISGAMQLGQHTFELKSSYQLGGDSDAQQPVGLYNLPIRVDAPTYVDEVTCEVSFNDAQSFATSPSAVNPALDAKRYEFGPFYQGVSYSWLRQLQTLEDTYGDAEAANLRSLFPVALTRPGTSVDWSGRELPRGYMFSKLDPWLLTQAAEDVLGGKLYRYSDTSYQYRFVFPWHGVEDGVFQYTSSEGDALLAFDSDRSTYWEVDGYNLGAEGQKANGDTDAVTMTVHNVDYRGAWIQVRLPLPIRLERLVMQPVISRSEATPEIHLVSSIDGSEDLQASLSVEASEARFTFVTPKVFDFTTSNGAYTGNSTMPFGGPTGEWFISRFDSPRRFDGMTLSTSNMKQVVQTLLVQSAMPLPYIVQMETSPGLTSTLQAQKPDHFTWRLQSSQYTRAGVYGGSSSLYDTNGTKYDGGVIMVSLANFRIVPWKIVLQPQTSNSGAPMRVHLLRSIDEKMTFSLWRTVSWPVSISIDDFQDIDSLCIVLEGEQREITIDYGSGMDLNAIDPDGKVQFNIISGLYTTVQALIDTLNTQWADRMMWSYDTNRITVTLQSGWQLTDCPAVRMLGFRTFPVTGEGIRADEAVTDTFIQISETQTMLFCNDDMSIAPFQIQIPAGRTYMGVMSIFDEVSRQVTDAQAVEQVRVTLFNDLRIVVVLPEGWYVPDGNLARLLGFTSFPLRNVTVAPTYPLFTGTEFVPMDVLFDLIVTWNRWELHHTSLDNWYTDTVYFKWLTSLCPNERSVWGVTAQSLKRHFWIESPYNTLALYDTELGRMIRATLPQKPYAIMELFNEAVTDALNEAVGDDSASYVFEAFIDVAQVGYAYIGTIESQVYGLSGELISRPRRFYLIRTELSDALGFTTYGVPGTSFRSNNTRAMLRTGSERGNITVQLHDYSEEARNPATFVVLGSNDGESWTYQYAVDELSRWMSTAEHATMNMNGETIVIPRIHGGGTFPNRAYQYFRIILLTGFTAGKIRIAGLKFYAMDYQTTSHTAIARIPYTSISQRDDVYLTSLNWLLQTFRLYQIYRGAPMLDYIVKEDYFFAPSTDQYDTTSSFSLSSTGIQDQTFETYRPAYSSVAQKMVRPLLAQGRYAGIAVAYEQKNRGYTAILQGYRDASGDYDHKCFSWRLCHQLYDYVSTGGAVINTLPGSVSAAFDKRFRSGLLTGVRLTNLGTKYASTDSPATMGDDTEFLLTGTGNQLLMDRARQQVDWEQEDEEDMVLVESPTLPRTPGVATLKVDFVDSDDVVSSTVASTKTPLFRKANFTLAFQEETSRPIAPTPASVNRESLAVRKR